MGEILAQIAGEMKRCAYVVGMGAIMVVLASTGALAQDDVLKIHYRAFLSEADHLGHDGVRLTQTAAILMQDRANNFLHGLADPQDERDSLFTFADSQRLIIHLLANGPTTGQVRQAIIDGNLLVEVEVWHRASGDYLVVHPVEAD